MEEQYIWTITGYSHAGKAPEKTKINDLIIVMVGKIRECENVGGMYMKAFTPDFDSLIAHQTPAWFQDVKFGIWSHWGPQSVPMYGDWYARNMYNQGTPQYLYHVRQNVSNEKHEKNFKR